MINSLITSISISVNGYDSFAADSVINGVVAPVHQWYSLLPFVTSATVTSSDSLELIDASLNKTAVNNAGKNEILRIAFVICKFYLKNFLLEL